MKRLEELDFTCQPISVGCDNSSLRSGRDLAAVYVTRVNKFDD
jgi:hypothetical protein